MLVKNKPDISILMPVYNAGIELRTCLDSIIEQSFQEFELVIVDNGSDDESPEILASYQNEYSDKIFVHRIEHNNFVGTVRNFALTKARGKYIYMCDSDDMLERHALSFLHARAETHHADVVYGYFRFINMQSHSQSFLGNDGEKEVSPGELILSGADYWRRLYRKTLIDEVIEKVGGIPEDTNFDDVAWLPVVHSYAKKIQSAERLIYNYFRRASSTVGGESSNIVKYSILSEQYAMDNCNPKYREYAELYVAKRIVNNLKNRWIYSDYLIEHIKHNWKNFKANRLIRQEYSVYHILEKYSKLTNHPMKKIVYLYSSKNDISIEYIESTKKYMFDECEVVVLNINPHVIQELEEKEIPEKFWKEYYILWNLYQTGGIYIDKSIIPEKAFNSLRYFESFFSFIDQNHFSDSLFGATRQNEIIKQILETYHNNYYNEKNFTLGERIRNVLNICYDIPLDGKTNLFDYQAAILAPEVVCYNAFHGRDEPSYFHLCCHDFSAKKQADNLYITIKNTSLAPLLEKHYSVALPELNIPPETATLMSENEFFKYRLNEIEISAAYRLALIISHIGEKHFVKMFKEIIKKLIHMRYNKKINKQEEQ